MFACEDCGLIFDEPDSIYIPLDDGVGWRKEEWACCPNCHNTNLADAEQCDECGDWVAPWWLNEEHICPNCEDDRKNWKEIRIG